MRSYSGPHFVTFELNTKRYSDTGRYPIRIRENADQNNSEHGDFSRSVVFCLNVFGKFNKSLFSFKHLMFLKIHIVQLVHKIKISIHLKKTFQR